MCAAMPDASVPLCNFMRSLWPIFPGVLFAVYGFVILGSYDFILPSQKLKLIMNISHMTYIDSILYVAYRDYIFLQFSLVTRFNLLFQR